MAKKTKIFVLSASSDDERMLINLLELLGKAFPEYFNRMGVTNLRKDRYNSARFELTVAAEGRPGDEVRAMIKAFRLGWKAHKDDNEAAQTGRLSAEEVRQLHREAQDENEAVRPLQPWLWNRSKHEE